MSSPRRPVLLTPEYEFEAQPGLPQHLPDDERILWQGAPDPWRLAVRAFHVRKLAIYFAAMLLWQLALRLEAGAGLAQALRGSGPMALAFGLAWAMLMAMAWMSARSTCYTLTNRRVVMRIGIVLTVSFNLPLVRMDAADLRAQAGGWGDLALAIERDTRIGWWHLWPHVRPWQLVRPQPMLRCIAEAPRVAALLSSAWAQANATSARPAAAAVAAEVPARAPAPHGLVAS